MNAEARRVQRLYQLLYALQTLATSLIWGINTLFLLDAGLNNAEAFTVNAAFTAGMMIFEIPTGVLADTRGRKLSYLLGTVTLAITTLGYVLMWSIHAPFWAWAIVSLLVGLGFTFFTGAFEAWLVDALAHVGYFKDGGDLETVLARGQIVEGAAMLAGTLGGGVLAQATNLAVPYAVRGAVLFLGAIVVLAAMRDIGFEPRKGKRVVAEVRRVLSASLHYGFGNRPVRWVLLAEPFIMGVGFFAFYALQPWLLKLYGKPGAYSIAGIGAALIGTAQIAGGLLVPLLRRIFRKRTSVLLLSAAAGILFLALIGLLPHFWAAILLVAAWGLVFAASLPVRQNYLNALIPSEQRATVLSFDSLLGSSGSVVFQPILGRSADAFGYAISFLFGAAIQLLALPFLWKARREQVDADDIRNNATETLQEST
jgi:MFS family permease